MVDLLTYGIWGWLTKQVGKPYLWILVLLSIILGLAYRAWRSRVRGGDYELNSKGSDLIFESELGEFSFDKEKKSFTANYGKKKQFTLAFDDIRNIAIITEDIDAMLSEIAFEGWDFLVDTLPEYTDVVKRYSITVVTKSFQRYPLIVMSQYTVKDLWNWGLQMQLALLSMVRLYVPIEMYAEDVYVKFKGVLSEDLVFDKNKIPYVKSE